MDEQFNTLQTGDEAALREFKTPWPKSIDELSRIVSAVTQRPHDYGTCVYAMSIAAEAAFNYVAHELGVTGFQASCADMDVLRRTRSLGGPFALIDGNDVLYPQYDTRRKVEELLEKWRPWAKEEAVKLIAKDDAAEFKASPAVREHWESLANGVTR